MASLQKYLISTPIFIIIVFFVISSASFKFAIGCYTSIFSFGDSLTDTGNLVRILGPEKPPPHFALPPYGETYFHCATGRCSDGRLIIDFIAQHLGLELVPPYFGVVNSSHGDYQQGVNFAVAGATAMDDAFFERIGILNSYKNISLGDQLAWFKQILPSLCNSPSSCNKFFKNSLFLMGEIGGNDYNNAFLSGRSLEEIQSFVDPVIRVIGSAITELIEIGAATIVVPGNFPIGCWAVYLSYFLNSAKEDYDPKTGCLIWLNKFSEVHNDRLLLQLDRIRGLYPHATIIYADYYNAVMPLFQSPLKYGFSGGALSACCGAGGPYNVNSSVECGYPPAKACGNPSIFVNWDSIHLTEAAYNWIAKGLFAEYTTPPINSPCISAVPKE